MEASGKGENSAIRREKHRVGALFRRDRACARVRPDFLENLMIDRLVRPASLCLGLAAAFLGCFVPSALALTIQCPSVAVGQSDQPVIFSSSSFDAPRLNEAVGAATLTLAADVGGLALSTLEGLVIEEGGQGEGLLVVSGSVTALNAALDGLVVTPPASFAGGFQVTLSSGGVSGTFRVCINAPLDAEQARQQILSGVSQVHSGVQPGRMVAYGPTAYDVAWYDGNLNEGPMIAAATMGLGRVLATPDHQFLNMSAYGNTSGTFYVNGIAWAAGSAEKNIHIVTRSQDVAQWLAAQGYTQVVTTGYANLEANLEGADLFIPPWLGSSVPEQALETLGNFIREGGGLFIAEYGVGYGIWWGKPIFEAPGNQLLREAGIGFSDGHRWDTGALNVSGAATGQLQGTTLVQMLKSPSDFSADDLNRAGVLLMRLSDALHPEDPLLQSIDSFFWALVETVTPSPATPVSSAWEKGLLNREWALIKNRAPQDVEKHRSAEPVFGAIPEEAPRVTRTVTIDPTTSRWHSTGLYLPPGEVMSVNVGAEALGLGFKIIISGHHDDIGAKSKWLRMPKVDRKVAFSGESFEVASAFGGAVYVATGNKSLDLPPFDVECVGAVEAPYFVLGETSDADWVAGIRDLPGPFAELVSPSVQISLPASFVKNLDDPTALMTFWNDVVNLQDELGQHAFLRSAGERMNVDVQISAGALHSGYPTQGPTSTGAILTDLKGLNAAGSWGWFHELGHEAQRRADKSWGSDNPYTFDGSVECTVNLFTTYVYDQKNLPNPGGWGWTKSRYQTMKRALDVLAEGETYASVGVGHKLAMFRQLRNGWGWETFQAVFQTYHEDQANSAQLMPSGDAEERDQWMLRFSNAVSHNMVPFMRDIWGIAISDEAASATQFMPPWLPAVGGIEGTLSTTVGAPLKLDLRGAALSHDGVALIGGLTAPANGSILEESGIWIYTPHEGFQGEDTFNYNVTSSTGHSAQSDVVIRVSNEGVLLDRWFGIEGSDITDLTNHPNYPDAPDDRRVVSGFESPANADDNYGARLRGFVVPPADGEYTFFIASDDHGELWISPDADPDNADLVATVTGWTSPQEWDKFPEQTSAPISLKKGSVIYVEALMKEGGGGDNLAVAWSKDGGPALLIEGENVHVYRANNEPPVAENDDLDVLQGQPSVLNILSNDTDADGDVLSVIWVGTTDGGALVEMEDDGSIIYQSTAEFQGEDRFNYTISDGFGGEATAKVVVTVKPAFSDPELTDGQDVVSSGDVGLGSDATGPDTPLHPAPDDEGCTGSGAPAPRVPLLLLAMVALIGSGRSRRSAASSQPKPGQA